MRILSMFRVRRANAVVFIVFACGIWLAAAEAPAHAGERAPRVRSRELPELLEKPDPRLVAAAREADTERLHALVAVHPGSRARAERDGCRLLHALGGELWLASLPTSSLARGALPASLSQAWALRPEDRHDPAHADWARVAARAPDGRAAIRVKCFADVAPAEASALLRSVGAAERAPRSFPGVYDVLAPIGAIESLVRSDLVRWVEPAAPRPADANNDMRLASGADVVQALGYGGEGILLGMWDSGIPDETHPDLVGRVIVGQSGLSTSLHPTHVAGIAIGDGSNSQSQGGGGWQWRGVATLASLVIYDAVNAIDEVTTAIETHDIDLSTNSWVYPVTPTDCSAFGTYGFDAPEFDALVRGSGGKPLPIVFAAGNERDDGDCGLDTTGGYRSLPPPATAKNVISVGAHQSDAGYMTPFSSWGPTDDGRMKPDMAAPGCQVTGDHGITSTQPGGTYVPLCGTSQAAPVVSGSIAILIEEWRARYPEDPRPSTSKALLGGFAVDRANPGPDYRFGLGAIRVDRSLAELRTATTIEDELAQGEIDAWSFTVPASLETLVVTIAWDDPPGVELAQAALVNDLDLELVSPSAASFLPFVLDPSQPSANASTGVNTRDNVEQVRVIAPAAGSWTARIVGTSVPEGPQAYSLVGFDRRAPADPASFAASAASDTSIALTWTRAGDGDRAGTLVVRGTAPPVWVPEEGVSYTVGSEPAAGVRVVAASDADHSSTPFIDGGLAPGTTYHYAAFSYDEIPNYSPGASSSAATTSVAVSAPPVSAEPAAFARLAVDGANPFRGVTVLRFELPRETRFRLAIYDALGRHVSTLRRGVLGAGAHRAEFDGRSDRGEALTAGVYFARLETPSGNRSVKLILLR